MRHFKIFKHGNLVKETTSDLQKPTEELVGWVCGKFDLQVNYSYLVIVDGVEAYNFVLRTSIQYQVHKLS